MHRRGKHRSRQDYFQAPRPQNCCHFCQPHHQLEFFFINVCFTPSDFTEGYHCTYLLDMSPPYQINSGVFSYQLSNTNNVQRVQIPKPLMITVHMINSIVEFIRPLLCPPPLPTSNMLRGRCLTSMSEGFKLLKPLLLRTISCLRYSRFVLFS